MRAPSVQFRPAVDVHLLRGQSFQILSDPPTDPSGPFFTQLLEVDESALNQHPNSKYDFYFSFDATKAADLGIHISNPSTNPRKPNCLITLDATEPADKNNRIRNFYLFVRSEDSDDSSKQETAIRIHIHNSISEVWIAPNPLTIYQGLYYRATLYARFDDNSVAMAGNTIHTGNRGSISTYNISPLIDVTWTSDLIRPGENTIRPAGFSGTHTISAEITYNGITHTATAQVIISDLLTSTTPLRAELVSTGLSPGFSKLDEAVNVLFLADGFTADQDYAFKVLILDYVADLVNKKITSPFNLLRGAINYWMVFVPSRESGATSFGELIVNEALTPVGTTYLEGYPVPSIVDPESNSVLDWGIRNLLYNVGLPILQTGNATYQEIGNLWKATTLLSSAQVDQLTDSRTELIDLWLTLSQRRLPEPRDTALGVTINDYTAAFTDHNYDLINLDSTRTQRDYLDDFFAGLRDPDGNLIGTTFIHSPSSTPDPTLPRGKDWDNIIIITTSKRGRAQNLDGYMFANIGDESTERLHGDFGTIRVAMEPPDIPIKLPLDAKGTITHELCHSFGLGDEYGESPPFNSYLNKPVNASLVADWPFAQYSGSGADLDIFSNVQTKDDLLVPVSDGTQRIQPYHIKWRYHRIQTCATVTALSVNANTLLLIVKTGQAAPFATGNTVFLRKRKKNEKLYTLSDFGSTIRLSVILDPDPVPPAFIDICDIESIDLATDTLRIKTRVGFPPVDAFQDIRLESGKTALVHVGQKITIQEAPAIGSIYTAIRNPPNKVQYALSPLVTIANVDPVNHQITITIPADFPDFLKTLTPNDDVLVYRPIDMPEGSRSADYPHAELIAQPVLNYLLANPYPFNANSTSDHNELIDKTSNSRIPGQLVPCCSSRKPEIIGLYSGGVSYHGGIYHPAAKCMMRNEMDGDKFVELCAVCRYTLINQIDPTKFTEFDTDYMARNIYPD
ncbi:hypothetical protein GO755_04165 [Spirosoma sp. HMF4905]|uniref:Uncharacterized protein n=1 Tax=Spirosoma arboris TaxID=2682092 RepID=A0A7K1S6E7_9BACT|nr:hypothetical protein [Spirosoma arboris]MVM29216.1 hypothetical protein [Spirosoma arboris]